MKLIGKKEFLENLDFYLGEIKSGKIFIYPTDTIYGLGCGARLGQSILNIREIKQRDSKPISIIAPGKNWIKENCSVFNLKELNKLPGPYTFIVDLVNRFSVSSSELVGELTGIGIRIPDNWFSNILVEERIPFVTTSVNLQGEDHLIDPANLKKKISEKVDYLIDSGILSGNPSTIIDLRSGERLR